MKWFSYIFSVYLLLLAIFPCCAVDDCPDEKPATEKAANHQKGDTDDCGSCSPFFSCEGCATATITLEAAHDMTTSFFSPPEYTEFITASIPAVHYDFWQPPRLG